MSELSDLIEKTKRERNRAIRMTCAKRIVIGPRAACPQTCSMDGGKGDFCKEVLDVVDCGIDPDARRLLGISDAS